MKYYVAIVSLLLHAVSLASALNLPGPGNATLHQKRFLPAVSEMEKQEAGSFQRIVNGADVKNNRFSYIVGLDFISDVHGRGGFCGGSIIHTIWILTAAHCAIAASSVKIFIEMRILGKSKLEYWVPSDHIVSHKDFVEHFFTADIALVLFPDVDFSESLQPVHLPRNGPPYPHYVNDSVIAVGWGRTNPHITTLASTLQYTTLTVISNEDCERSYDNIRIYPGKICTDGQTGGAVCKGDSGGPLVLETSRTIIGIISTHHIRGCALGYPDAFTRVDHYLGWIHEITGIPI